MCSVCCGCFSPLPFLLPLLELGLQCSITLCVCGMFPSPLVVRIPKLLGFPMNPLDLATGGPGWETFMNFSKRKSNSRAPAIWIFYSQVAVGIFMRHVWIALGTRGMVLTAFIGSEVPVLLVPPLVELDERKKIFASFNGDLFCLSPSSFSTSPPFPLPLLPLSLTSVICCSYPFSEEIDEGCKYMDKRWGLDKISWWY